MTGRIVYLMRGLPSSGKSFTAHHLAGDAGVVCETDAYFCSEVGNDPNAYDFDRSLVDLAGRWNFERFARAVDEAVTPIVVDRGNGLSLTTQVYARYALDSGYEVVLSEPTSPWWSEIRVLLMYRKLTRPVLDRWAERLAEISRSTHRVPAKEIRRLMDKWKHDLTIADIRNYGRGVPKPPNGAAQPNDRERRADSHFAAGDDDVLMVFDDVKGEFLHD